MKKVLFEYYELENTVNEYNSRVSGRYVTLETAKEDMKNHCDWYCGNGTGTIYVVRFITVNDRTVEKSREIVYKS